MSFISPAAAEIAVHATIVLIAKMVLVAGTP